MNRTTRGIATLLLDGKSIFPADLSLWQMSYNLLTMGLPKQRVRRRPEQTSIASPAVVWAQPVQVGFDWDVVLDSPLPLSNGPIVDAVAGDHVPPDGNEPMVSMWLVDALTGAPSMQMIPASVAALISSSSWSPADMGPGANH